MAWVRPPLLVSGTLIKEAALIPSCAPRGNSVGIQGTVPNTSMWSPYLFWRQTPKPLPVDPGPPGEPKPLTLAPLPFPFRLSMNTRCGWRPVTGLSLLPSTLFLHAERPFLQLSANQLRPALASRATENTRCSADLVRYLT